MTRQNLIDISIQQYGNPEAVAILIDDNPELFANDREFGITTSISGDFELSIRDEDDMMNKKVLKELDGKVIIS